MTGLLDTQNQRWAKDKTKFGYRMLEKMGWREGKGLGAREDGSTEHLRARKCSTAAGVGRAAAAGAVWDLPAAVSAGLNDVLAGLAPVSAEGAEARETAKEGGQKGGVARGYYERRAAQKNVRNYSQNALREIFGGAACGTGSDAVPEERGQVVRAETRRDLKRDVSVKEEPRTDTDVPAERDVETRREKKGEVAVKPEAVAKPEVNMKHEMRDRDREREEREKRERKMLRKKDRRDKKGKSAKKLGVKSKIRKEDEAKRKMKLKVKLKKEKLDR